MPSYSVCLSIFTIFTYMYVKVAKAMYFIYKFKTVIDVVDIQLCCHTLEITHDRDTCQKINRKYKCITVF